MIKYNTFEIICGFFFKPNQNLDPKIKAISGGYLKIQRDQNLEH